MDQAEEGIMSRRDLGEEEPQSAEGRSERSLVRKKGQVPGLAAKVERKVSKRREANEQKSIIVELFKELIATINGHVNTSQSKKHGQQEQPRVPKRKIETAATASGTAPTKQPRPRRPQGEQNNSLKRHKSVCDPKQAMQPHKKSAQEEQHKKRLLECKQSVFANYSMLMRYSIIEETAEEKAAKGEESGSEERITNNHQETHAK